MKELVSIIISNYNYEKYISEAIESVLAQTYQNFELIIVDDGSADHSKEIIQKYYEQYPDQIKIILKENGGQASAFNAGFEIASGEIIAFLDADDYWYEDKLDTVVKYHQYHKGIQHNLLINNEKKLTLLEDGIAKQKEGLEKYGFLGTTGTIPTSGLSFKREALLKIFPIPEKEYRICADLYIKILFLNYHDIFSIDNPKGCYRAHDSNNWYNNQSGTEHYPNFTLNLLNKVRHREGKTVIHKESSEAKTVAKFLLDYLTFDHSEKYVLYGTGELAKCFYEELKDKLDIVYFSGSFVKEEGTFIFDKEVKKLDYIVNHQGEYDRIIIASTLVVEISEFLIENGFDSEQLVIPRF